MKTEFEKYSPYIILTGIYLVSILLTDAYFWADTADYVDAVIADREGKYYYFWEFGHLFWQPLGAVGAYFFASAPNELQSRIEINVIFQAISYVSGGIVVVLLTGILRKLEINLNVLIMTVTIFILSYAFLNFTQTGTSYIGALAFFLAGIFCILSSDNNKFFIWNILAGVCFAASLSLWLTFLWALPAAFLSPFFFLKHNHQRFKEVSVSLISFAVVIGLSYLTVMAVMGISDLNGLREWIAEASHGNETRGIHRTVFGFARSFVYLGNDGVLFKRFLLGDSYNPTSFFSLLEGSLWKFFLFYLLAGSILFLLWKNETRRGILLWLAIAAVPMFTFAALYDGAALERYFPLFSFVVIATAVAFNTIRFSKLRYLSLAAAIILIISNISFLSVWNISKKQSEFSDRVSEFSKSVDDGDAVFLVNWNDDLINFNRSFPFHEANLYGKVFLNAVVTPGSEQTEQWREEFAARVIPAWKKGKSVWLSSRAFIEKPKSGWNWVEGDDKNVSWREFPEFFNKLERGEVVGDESGFTRILPSEANIRFLNELKDKFKGKIIYIDREK